MWHWNSLWAPAPGDPPAIDDPKLWQAPWTSEQTLALQARNWETMLSTAHSWWALMLSTWPMTPSWPLPSPAIDPAAATGIEPLVAQPPAPRKAASPRKRSAAARKTGAARKS